LQRYRESNFCTDLIFAHAFWIRDISGTAGPICGKFWNLDPIFARIKSKEINKINPSAFCPLFSVFCKKSVQKVLGLICIISSIIILAKIGSRIPNLAQIRQVVVQITHIQKPDFADF
jgi:hypothetical protein